MSKGPPSMSFYPGDWLKDEALSQCEPATRGIWVDLLCAMWLAKAPEISGTATQLARNCRCSPDELIEAIEDLLATKTADVTFCNHDVIKIESRRLQRLEESRKSTCSKVQKHREKKKQASKAGAPGADVTGCNPAPSPSSSFSPSGEKILRPSHALLDNQRRARIPGSPVAADWVWTEDLLKEIYDAYPKQVGAVSAKRAIARALTDISDRFETPDAAWIWLLSRTTAYATSPLVRNQSTRFIPNPTKWFDAGQYDDDPATWADPGKDGANTVGGRAASVSEQLEQAAQAAESETT